jgi:hypothetical protein
MLSLVSIEELRVDRSLWSSQRPLMDKHAALPPLHKHDCGNVDPICIQDFKVASHNLNRELQYLSFESFEHKTFLFFFTASYLCSWSRLISGIPYSHDVLRRKKKRKKKMTFWNTQDDVLCSPHAFSAYCRKLT